jgi:hypothetical protein
LNLMPGRHFSLEKKSLPNLIPKTSFFIMRCHDIDLSIQLIPLYVIFLLDSYLLVP